MTKNEALKILNCTEAEEVIDIYDERLFELKSKFLQVIPPIKIIHSIVKKIKRITEAANVFIDLEKLVVYDTFLDLNQMSLDDFLDFYQAELAKIRLRISNTSNGYGFLNEVSVIESLQKELIFKLAKFDLPIDQYIERWPIKLSTPFKVYDLQVELKENQLKETEISEYIRGQIANDNFEKFTELTLAVINAKKQIVFNGLTREI